MSCSHSNIYERNGRIPFGMPVRQGNPAYTEAPNKFFGREYFIITYETCPDAIQKCLPPGLKAPEPIVKYEFMRMPNTSGFGSFHESGQVIPVIYDGGPGNYVHSMFLDCHPPIAGGREIWGFPKKLAAPKIEYDGDTLLGTLDYGNVRVATGTMGLKFNQIDTRTIVTSLSEPNFLVKSIPGVDGRPAICQLVRYYMTNISVDWAFDGPVALDIFSHAMAPVNELPIKKILGGIHFVANLTLPYGDVLIDYLE
ncbi:acetoacetate decarboxylase [Aeromonas sp. JL9]|uniref:acetoacetate decarboxylase n=1 Tax=Aeromonas sp. JL9 TaxID=2950549 RepID=UPI00210E9DA6|nr:acetoacetate decarboxylase [Aeromonas sp. JL9]MCQ4111519.1 acetoacetate decarboxylase [Aeromonas sp. JL9]